jgi:hypothetical protein
MRKDKDKMAIATRPMVLFLHIGWAREYLGAPTDVPQGKFGFMKDGSEEANEALNFKSYKGRCFGYAPRGTIDIKRLGAPAGADHQDDILVVFTATNPDGSGRYVVGWYKDARVHSELQNTRPNRGKPYFIAEANAADAHRVAVDDRTFFVPSMREGWPGVASAFYASANLSPDNIDKLLSYIGGSPSIGFADVPLERPSNGAPRQNDPELRARVEAAAVAMVQRHYEAKGCVVQSVEDENLGWDLDITFGARIFRVEVKGRSGSGAVELTPNEYQSMTDERVRMSYRLAIVHDALTTDRRLTIFQYAPGDDAWLSDQADQLKLRLMTGAVASF